MSKNSITPTLSLHRDWIDQVMAHLTSIIVLQRQRLSDRQSQRLSEISDYLQGALKQGNFNAR